MVLVRSKRSYAYAENFERREKLGHRNLGGYMGVIFFRHNCQDTSSTMPINEINKFLPITLVYLLLTSFQFNGTPYIIKMWREKKKKPGIIF